MAEHFCGKNRSLHTSNGGCEIFLRGLLVFGSQCTSDSQEHHSVIGFLRGRCDKPDGFRSFEVYPLPEEIGTGEALRFLSEIVYCFTQSLIDGIIPESLRDDFYDLDLQLRWAAFAAEFYELLRDSAPSALTNLQISFRDKEKVVRLHRLHLRLVDSRKNSRLAEQLDLLSEIINLGKKGDTLSLMWPYFSYKADILVEMCHTDTAITTLREGACYADGKDRKMMMDYAECLEKEAAKDWNTGEET